GAIRRPAARAGRSAPAERRARTARRRADRGVGRVNEALAKREAQLGESEQRLQGILDHSPAAIYVKDLDGRYLLVNRRVEQLFARSREELLGKTDHDVLAPRLADMYRMNDQRVAAERRALQFEEASLQPDGIRVHASSKFPLFDGSGTIYAICGIS